MFEPTPFADHPLETIPSSDLVLMIPEWRSLLNGKVRVVFQRIADSMRLFLNGAGAGSGSGVARHAECIQSAALSF